MTIVANLNPPNHMKNKHKLLSRLILATLVIAGGSSCGLLRNRNDWAMGKGSSPVYVPTRIGKPENGEPVRGGN
ncbi:MAG: hypothetical protein K1X78_26920 [Verrucomicrobiaceae bacterium]|nr:hypothetical protein [Verrucomicrobiaceae bacterium]